MASIIDEEGYNQGFILNPAQLERLRRRAKAIISEMRLPVDSRKRSQVRILELGCGTGELANHLVSLSGAQVTGVDISHKFITEAKERFSVPGLRFSVVDIAREKPGSEAEKYDFIVGNGILHHLYYHYDSFFPALADWLVPGGRLVFWEPNLLNPYIYLIFSYSYFRKLAKLEPDEMACTPKYMKRKLMQSGYCNVRVCIRDFLVPNTPKCLIKPVIVLGNLLEKIPVIRTSAQSLFISAQRPL